MENNNLNMRELSRAVICDECIKTSPELKEIKGGEWHCDYCGRLLYKFATNNIVSDLLINTATAKIKLEYGKMTISARCPNPNCKQENTRPINWGWMP
jgi:ribosomal protein L37AE/L43A